MFDFIVSNVAVVICVLSGLGLLVVEMFVPGFGVPGVSGIVLLLAGAVLVGIKHGLLAAVGLIVIIVALVAIMLSVALKSAADGRLSKSKLILHESESSREGFLSSGDMSVFLGREGETRTALRPSGIAEFDGVRLNVVSDGVFIAQGVRVKIVRVDGNRILVHTI